MPNCASHVESIRKLAESSVHVVRNMALLLRPSMLDDLGLVPALQWQAREISKRTAMAVTVDAETWPTICPKSTRPASIAWCRRPCTTAPGTPSRAACAFEVVQEGTRIRLSVTDDGQGFDSTRTRGLGLLGMEERVTHLGGSFQLQSEPGHGVRVRVEIPLTARAVEVVA